MLRNHLRKLLPGLTDSLHDRPQNPDECIMSLSCSLSKHLLQRAARGAAGHGSPRWQLHFRNSPIRKQPTVLNSHTRSVSKHTRVAAIGSGTLSKQAASASQVDTDSPWLVVGLGNPGARYNGTRHNVGFQVLDTLAKQAGVSLTSAKDKALQARSVIAGQQVVLAKPITFMNLSGEAVGKLTHYYKIPPQRVLVIYDDLDLPLGKVRLRAKGSHGGHNGMRSIMQYMKGAQDFPRLKIGIGRPEGRMPVAAFVLQAFTKTEEVEISIAVQECCDVVRAIMAVGLERALSGVRA